MNELERFETKFMPEPNSGCWLWLSYINPWGYGFTRTNKRGELAHRKSYRLFKGTFTADLLVLHKCDNPACVNPDHLYLGTPADNAADTAERGRWGKPRRLPRGVVRPSARLSDDDVREIRCSRVPNAVLASLHNCDPSTICRVKQRTAYAHVED